jgi:hypothetical protein
MSTAANALDITSAGLVKFNGTATFSGVTTTNHNVLVGAASNGITSIAPSATSGVPLVSGGASADPSFTTAVVAGGGTGQVTLTNHGVLVGAGTSAITQLSTGSSGQVLQSGGASADPTYSTATYPATAGTSGNLLVSDGTNIVSSSASASGASLVYLLSQSANNSTALTYTSLITSTYSSYLIIGSNVTPATNGDKIKIQVSTNNGSSYVTSSYLSGGTGAAYNSTTLANTSITSGLLITAAEDNNSVSTCYGYLTNLQNGAAARYIGMSTDFSSAVPRWTACTGSSTSTSVNAIKILGNVGNITTGTFTLYGIKES